MVQLYIFYSFNYAIASLGKKALLIVTSEEWKKSKITY